VADNETKVADRRGKDFHRRRLGTKMSTSTNKRNDSDSTEKRLLRGYNCHETGHVAGKCPKPRVECGNCKLLGHEAGKCRRPKTSGPSVRLLCSSDTQDCYFLECAINGKPLKGYIDTGCSIVTLRKATAIELQLEQRPSTQLIRGYAGGVTPALGEAEVTLTVDLITAKVTASIVEDRVQSVLVITGQTILNRVGVTMVLRDNQIRLFDNHLAALPGLDDLPSRKVALRSKEDVVIPSHTIGFFDVYSPETHDGDVYVEATTRQQPNHEYSIPGCITSTGGVILVRNAADSSLVFSRGQLLVRGLPCKLESFTNEVSNFSITPGNLQPFLVDDVTNQLGPNLIERERFQVLQLLNEFRDCFASDTCELGKTTITKMHIELNDNVPVTYRPYRLAHPEREAVRELVQDLLTNGIIRESQSSYSSPILLVKKKTGEYRMCVDYRVLNAKTRTLRHSY
jgi:hypothetical protein